MIATDESTLASSSMAMHSVSRSAPIPPYSSGNGRPNNPSSPILRTTSSGKAWVRSHSSAWGATSVSANSLTTLRNASCSLDRLEVHRDTSVRGPAPRLSQREAPVGQPSTT